MEIATTDTGSGCGNFYALRQDRRLTSRIVTLLLTSLTSVNGATGAVAKAQEMLREGKIENPSDPATTAVGDQRTYLFAEFAKTTGAATGTGSVPGVALGVRLKSDPSRVYRSDHDQPTWSIDRDGPVATTVELPEGTRPSDIASVEAIRRPTGLGDNGAPATVTAVNRGFFLDASYLPQSSFLTWKGSVALTPQNPSAVLWRP